MKRRLLKNWLLAFSISLLSVPFFSNTFAQQTLEYDVEYIPPIVELIREGRQSFTINTIDYNDPRYQKTDIDQYIKYIPNYWLRGDFDEIYNDGYDIKKVNSFVEESTEQNVWTSENGIRNYTTLWNNTNFLSKSMDFWLDQKTTTYLDFSIPTDISNWENKLNIQLNANWKSIWLKSSGIYINNQKALHSINLFPKLQTTAGNNEFHWRFKITHDRKNSSINYTLWKQIFKNKIEWNGYGDNLEPLFSYITATNETELNQQKANWTYGVFDTKITNENDSKGIVLKRVNGIMSQRGDLKLIFPIILDVKAKATFNFKIDKAMNFKLALNGGNNDCETFYVSDTTSCWFSLFHYNKDDKKFYWENKTKSLDFNEDIVGTYRMHILIVNNEHYEKMANIILEKKEGDIYKIKANISFTDIEQDYLWNIAMLFDIPELDVKYGEFLSYSLYSWGYHNKVWYGLKIYDKWNNSKIKTREELEKVLNVKNHTVVKTYNFANLFDFPGWIRKFPLYKNDILLKNDRTEIYEYSTLWTISQIGGLTVKDFQINSPKRKVFVYVNGVFIAENDMSHGDAPTLVIPTLKLKNGINKISIFEIQDNSVPWNIEGVKWNLLPWSYVVFDENWNNYIEATPFFEFKEVGQNLSFADYRTTFNYNNPSTSTNRAGLYGIRTFWLKRANFANKDIEKKYYADLIRNFQVDFYWNDLTEINSFNDTDLILSKLSLSSTLEKDWYGLNLYKKSSTDIPWNWYNAVTSWFVDPNPEEALVYTNGLINKGGMLGLTTDDENYYTFIGKDIDTTKDDIILFKGNIAANGDANTEFFLDKDNYLIFGNKSSTIFDAEDKLFYNTKFLWQIEDAIQPFKFSLYNRKVNWTVSTINNITLSSNLLEEDYTNTFNTSPASYQGFNGFRINKTLNTFQPDLKGTQLDKYLIYYKHFKLQ